MEVAGVAGAAVDSVARNATPRAIPPQAHQITPHAGINSVIGKHVIARAVSVDPLRIVIPTPSRAVLITTENLATLTCKSATHNAAMATTRVLSTTARLRVIPINVRNVTQRRIPSANG